MRLLLVLVFLLAPLQASASVIIDLNKTSVEQLTDLQTGVSDELIQAIIDYRKKHGAFNKPDDLLNVPGMDEEGFNQLFPFEMNGSIVIEVEEPKGLSPY